MNGGQTASDQLGEMIRRLRALDHVITHFVVGPERHGTLRPMGQTPSGGRPSIAAQPSLNTKAKQRCELYSPRFVVAS